MVSGASSDSRSVKQSTVSKQKSRTTAVPITDHVRTVPKRDSRTAAVPVPDRDRTASKRYSRSTAVLLAA